MSFPAAARVSSAGLSCLSHLRSKAWGMWPSQKEKSQTLGKIHLQNAPAQNVRQILVYKPNLLPCVTTAESKYHTDLIIFCFVVQFICISFPFSRMREASSRPRREYKPKPRETYDLGDPDQSNGGFSYNPTPKVPGKVVLCVCVHTQVPLEQPPWDGGGLLCLEMMFLECWMCLHKLVALKTAEMPLDLGCFSLVAQQTLR